MKEATFSHWLVKHFREHGCFVQRLEVTTGSGVPDLAVLYQGKTFWIELKWDTDHIRPEQHIWGLKAIQANVPVFYVCGYEKDQKMDLFVSSSLNKPMSKSFKLNLLVCSLKRTKESIDILLETVTKYAENESRR